MPSSSPARAGALVLLVASLAGVALALYAYLAPLTGVTGTLGALIVILTCALLAIMALALMAVKARAGRNLLRALILIVLAGTAFAALLLHEWWLVAAMVLGLVGLIIDMVRPASPTYAQGAR
ncbi:hypothetical protein [Kushneria aurantia]|uniref:Uncharacterized protein n=1 Tax=Kushneria aurantia TaxID=504092 RepID=A0ABV6G125_9GAMM|nr:hypothetical protein [Kushneria aurantia]